MDISYSTSFVLIGVRTPQFGMYVFRERTQGEDAMATQITSNQVKLFLLDADTSLRRLQSLYRAQDVGAAQQGSNSHLIYQNALLTLLGQIALFPNIHSTLQDSLICVGRANNSVEGLESILLTLLNAAAVTGDNQRFQQTLALWTDVGASTNSSISSDLNPVLFYNVTNKSLTVVPGGGIDPLRPSGSQHALTKDQAALVKALERIVGSFIISNVFGGKNPLDDVPADVKNDIRTIQAGAELIGVAFLAVGALGISLGPAGVIVAGVIFVASFLYDSFQQASEAKDGLSSAQAVDVTIAPTTISEGTLVSNGDGTVSLVTTTSSEGGIIGTGPSADTVSTGIGVDSSILGI